MALCVCEYCGKAFNSLGSSICPECMKRLDAAYAKAKKFIYQNSQAATFTSIVENTGISDKALSYLIAQGRITLGGRSGGGHKCKVCGKEAEEGILCNRCKEKLRSEKLFSTALEGGKNDIKKTRSSVLPLTKK